MNGKQSTEKVSSIKHSKSSLNVISFFSGIMGLDNGLKQKGFNILLTCELDKTCRSVISLNDPEVGIISDIKKYSIEDILFFASVKNKKNIDVIVGGPPCQAFSTAGKQKGFTDERGNVFLKYIETIEELKPKYFVIENVRGLLSTKLFTEHNEYGLKGLSDVPGSALYYVIRRLEDSGYRINFNLYNSANFGVPQIRERVVIIGTHSKERVPFLAPTNSNNPDFGLPPWINLKQILNGFKDDHEYLEFSKGTLKYLKYLKEGENWRNLPMEIVREAMGKSYLLGGGKTGFYRRLSFHKPSPTLVTHPSMPATLLCHPTKDRPLSIQEYKRIQQFPDNYKLLGSLTEKYKQIGNAVPVGLGLAIGQAILNHSKGIHVPEAKNFEYSRYKGTSYDEWIPSFESTFIRNRSFQYSFF